MSVADEDFTTQAKATNPKSEIRKKPEIRSPKSQGVRPSAIDYDGVYNTAFLKEAGSRFWVELTRATG